jgi:GAF domain-containing protein
MIGQCVALGQARIALDVGDEPQRFDNPWLPDTRSEIALPLVSRGRTIGALTIQSTQEAAYSREDILALQAMADQLAIAIDTARLFEETRARAERERIVRSVADRVRRGVDSDAIVRTALQELSKMLGSSRSVACLNPREWLLSLGGPPRDEQDGSQSRRGEP